MTLPKSVVRRYMLLIIVITVSRKLHSKQDDGVGKHLHFCSTKAAKYNVQITFTHDATILCTIYMQFYTNPEYITSDPICKPVRKYPITLECSLCNPCL